MRSFFASTTAEGPTISLAAEKLFDLGPIPISNAMVLGLIGSLGIITWLMLTTRAIQRGSRSRNSYFVLWIFQILYDTTVEVIGNKAVARKVAPLAITLVFFFIINNWLALLPFLNSVTYNGHSIIRGAAADLNTTFALALISIGTAQLLAFKHRGFFGNLHRYFSNPFKSPLHFFEGLLELIAEFSRTAALAMRMFGNVFGGEVLLAVIAFLTSYAGVIALPVFYALELFVGAIQGYVFFMLTIAFISLGLPQDDTHAVKDEHDADAPRADLSKKSNIPQRA